MTTNEVTWSSAYYALIPIAINSMLSPREPTGTTCGFDSSLRIYLRSSPLVCAVDAFFIFIRFLFFIRNRNRGHRHSLARTAREIRALRGMKNEKPSHHHENTARERLWKQDVNTYIMYLFIAFGVMTQLLRIFYFEGGEGAIQWTKAWAGMYFGSWVVVEATYWFAWLDHDDGEEVNLAQIKHMDRSIARWEKACGVLAILLQLGILANVDMKHIPLDPNIPQRWWFRGIRFAAHCAVCVVHLPFLFISWEIDARRPLHPKYMGVLLAFIVVPHVISAATQESRFSALYFMVSVMISYSAWMLYFFPWTKKWILFCENRAVVVQPGELVQAAGIGQQQPQINLGPNGNGAEADDGKGWQNVLAFDFFLRIVVFSAYWYVWHYNPTGTSQPQWTSYLPSL